MEYIRGGFFSINNVKEVGCLNGTSKTFFFFYYLLFGVLISMLSEILKKNTDMVDQINSSNDFN